MRLVLVVEVPGIRDPDSPAADRFIAGVESDGITLPPGGRWHVSEALGELPPGASLVATVESATLDSGRFSAATVAYWFEWFRARGAIPPDAETAVAWIRDAEERIGRSLDNLPDSWIPADSSRGGD